jgi:DNA-binding IclR family transcriptional regulator
LQSKKTVDAVVAEIKSSATKVAAVDRAIEVLLAFRPGENNLSLAQLAERTGMYKSTILRLLQTLEARSFVARLSGGGYRLGPALFHLGMIYQKSFHLEDIVTPQLAALTETTGESASFFVSDGPSRSCLFRVEPKQAIRHHVEVGERLSISRGATGKVLTLFSAGANAATSEEFEQLPIISIGSNPLDISVIAGPVFGHGGTLIGAVSISGPTSRFASKARQRASMTLMAALKILTSQLGGDPQAFSASRAKQR